MGDAVKSLGATSGIKTDIDKLREFYDDKIQGPVESFIQDLMDAKNRIGELQSEKTKLRRTKKKIRALAIAWKKRERAIKKWKNAFIKKQFQKSKYYILIQE